MAATAPSFAAVNEKEAWIVHLEIRVTSASVE